MENPKERLVIIDGDGLAFHSLRETLKESLEALDDKLFNIFSKTQATQYLLFISKGKYFRHDIFPDYKKKRQDYVKDRITYVRTLKAVLQDKYAAQYTPRVEADDLCAYYYTQFCKYPEFVTILSSPDKDLLKNLPSHNPEGHFNYTYKTTETEEIIRGWWVDTSKEEANRTFWASMIIGDSSDGIPGLFRKGAKYVDKIFSPYEAKEQTPNYEEIVFREFIAFFGISQGIFEYQKHYRLLHLFDCDDDFLREIGEIPPVALPGAVEHINNPFNPSEASGFLNDDNL